MSAREPHPRDVERLVDAIVTRTRLRGARRDRLAADLREHLEDAMLAGRSPASIAATFGDPELVAALVDQSPPPARSVRYVRRLVAAGALIGAGLYGTSAARLGTFSPEPAIAPGALTSFDARSTNSVELTPESYASFRRIARGDRGHADSLARALRIARAMKGVHSRSVGARLLEPLYFARTSSVDDVWLAARSMAAPAEPTRRSVSWTSSARRTPGTSPSPKRDTRP